MWSPGDVGDNLGHRSRSTGSPWKTRSVSSETGGTNDTFLTPRAPSYGRRPKIFLVRTACFPRPYIIITAHVTYQTEASAMYRLPKLAYVFCEALYVAVGARSAYVRVASSELPRKLCQGNDKKNTKKNVWGG